MCLCGWMQVWLEGCACTWVSSCVHICRNLHRRVGVSVCMCVCVSFDCYCYANPSVCQISFQTLSLAFLRRIRAKQNKQQSSKTIRRQPQTHLSPPFISQHLQTFLHVSMHSRPARLVELGQKTQKNLPPQSINQSKTCLFGTFCGWD